MSSILETVIANTRDQLPSVIRNYGSALTLEAHHPHAIAVVFRRLGVCRMLTEGVVEPLFLAQMQASSAYLHGLRILTVADQVTSRGGAFWDAIGGEYWTAAAEIAQHSRMTQNPTWEHEDDFLYVAFLMTRYSLAANGSDHERNASATRQQEMLDRWEKVVAGGRDPRLQLCRSLLHQEEASFQEAFADIAAMREADIRKQTSHGSIPSEDAAWFLPFWGEGLALIRLADREGLRIDDPCPMVPSLTRAKNRFIFDPNAWTQVDFVPRLQP